MTSGNKCKVKDILVNQLGVPPMEAIKIATTNSADLLGLADKTGAVRAGLWADLDDEV